MTTNEMQSVRLQPLSGHCAYEFASRVEEPARRRHEGSVGVAFQVRQHGHEYAPLIWRGQRVATSVKTQGVVSTSP